MSKEINRIHWKCRRGMREIDLLLREFSRNSLEKLNNDDLLLFEEILSMMIKACMILSLSKSH